MKTIRANQKLRRLANFAYAVGLVSLSVAIGLSLTSGLTQAASLAATAPGLGTAASFVVLGGSTVTNTGSSTLGGDLGVSPGTAITGFPPGTVTGTIHAGDATAGQAQNAVSTAYNSLAGQQCDSDLTGQDLGGKTLTAGVYCFSSSAQLTGTLTLNAEGNPDAVWVFQIGSTLTTASGSSVQVTNSGGACTVFWQVGTSATLGTSSSFLGNILADQSITLTTGANVSGRLLAMSGAVTLDTNNISLPPCGQAADTATSTVTSTITSTLETGATNTATATATATTTLTLEAGATNTATETATPTITMTLEGGATNTETATPTTTMTLEGGATNTETATPTITMTLEGGATNTETATPTITMTLEGGATNTETATSTITMTLEAGPANTETETPTITLTLEAGAANTETVTSTPRVRRTHTADTEVPATEENTSQPPSVVVVDTPIPLIPVTGIDFAEVKALASRQSTQFGLGALGLGLILLGYVLRRYLDK